MESGSFRFEDFFLDTGDRRLRRGNLPVELNSRYLDALSLLVREQGKLVSKDRFLDEVWRGVPVTDEALTQCIKTLRRQLGDSAARPRFIETVPKHGYRFIAPVKSVAGEEEASESNAARSRPPMTDSWRRILVVSGAGTIGGGFAGLIGGLFYGFAGASQPLAPGMGAVSVLLVLTSLTIVVALMGAAGVSFGIAATGSGRGLQWNIAGGALGGMTVGAVVKLLGLDGFNLLLGKSPGDITGGAEGALLGGAIGLGAWLASRDSGTGSLRRGAAIAALVSGTAGLLIVLLGGRLMGGSLDLLAQGFPDSRLRLDQIGGLIGEQGFGPVSHMLTGTLEGALFGACVVGAMTLARRGLSPGT